MIKLILILTILSTQLWGQSGRYRINTVDTEIAEGYVTITDSFIKIVRDSTVTTLPVIDTGKYKQSYYYILEGCMDGRSYRGSGMLTASSSESLGNHYRRYYSALYIELRARQSYISSKYSIYYDK